MANIDFGGSGAARTVTVTPAANLAGSTTIRITVSDGVASAFDEFVLGFPAVNDAPTISNIISQTFSEDTSTGAIGFTVGDVETAPGSLTLTGTSSNTALVPVANIDFGGSGAARTVTVTPAANLAGSTTIRITVSDGVASAFDEFVLGFPAVNDVPTISNIISQTFSEDTSTGAIGFTVGDVETAPGSLTLTGTSSNTALVPVANIVFGGSGAARTVTVTPAANLAGSTTIRITVSDGVASAFDEFVLGFPAVNDVPTISNIISQTFSEDTSTGAIGFTVGDVETAPGSLTLTGTSSNTALVPVANIDFGGSGAARTVTVTPAANLAGSTTIRITVSDGVASAFDEFVLGFPAVNDAPTISNIISQTFSEDTSTGAIGFTVGDVETAPGSLTLTGTSSNTALVPVANIDFGGSGAARTVTVTPAANLAGSTTIRITVSDGVASAFDEFVLGFPAVNDVPTFAPGPNPTVDEDAGSPERGQLGGSGGHRGGGPVGQLHRHRQLQPGDVLGRPRHLPRRDADLHPRRQRQRGGHHHRGGPRRRGHGQRRGGHLGPPELHHHGEGGQRRAHHLRHRRSLHAGGHPHRGHRLHRGRHRDRRRRPDPQRHVVEHRPGAGGRRRLRRLGG